MKLTNLIDLLLAIAIVAGALHVGGAVVDWVKRTNTPFGAVAIVLKGE